MFLLIVVWYTFSAMPAYAYIDPGTGSMLFSVILCSLTTLLFLFNSVVLKLKHLFYRKGTVSQNKHKFVIYSEGNKYYSVFKPVLDEFEKRQIPVMYYTSSEEDSVLSEKYDFVKSEFLGKGNRAYFKLAFLQADVCLMTTPQLDVLQLKRSKNVKHYSHIFHSIGFSMDYHLFSLDYFDSVLCDAQYQVPMVREIEQKRNLPAKQLPVVGSTYMDYNRQNFIVSRDIDKPFTILVAPSWGKNGLLYRFGEKVLDKLVDTEYSIIVRPHPQSIQVEPELINRLKSRYSNNKNIVWDFENNNMLSMSRADVLISDFSCIMMDYAFLYKKPFIYIDSDVNLEMMDCADLDTLPWRFKIMDTIGKKLNLENDEISKIVDIINEMKSNEDVLKRIEDASHYAWEYQGQAAKNVVDFLIKTQLEVSSEC